jgi:hypothetical protein
VSFFIGIQELKMKILFAYKVLSNSPDSKNGNSVCSRKAGSSNLKKMRARE